METGAISHAQIEVRLTGADGAPLPGVTGTLLGGRIDERTELSDARGKMVFRDLPPGTYELTFAHDGFADVHRDITIHETDERDPMEVAMQPTKA